MRRQRRPLLRHKLELQKLETFEDEIGQVKTEWVTIAYPWAAVEPVSGKEYWAAAYLQAETTHRVTIRYRPGVTSLDQRLLLNGRILEIESAINVDEAGRWLELLCKEKAGSNE